MSEYRLRFYEKERELFPVANSVHLSDKGAEIIIEKLRRHFNLDKHPRIVTKFRNNGVDSGTCYYLNRKIILNHEPSLLVICHEFAHLLNFEKGKSHHHTKQLLTTIKRLLDYCFKKQCWVEEIYRRCS